MCLEASEVCEVKSSRSDLKISCGCWLDARSCWWYYWFRLKIQEQRYTQRPSSPMHRVSRTIRRHWDITGRSAQHNEKAFLKSQKYLSPFAHQYVFCCWGQNLGNVVWSSLAVNLDRRACSRPVTSHVQPPQLRSLCLLTDYLQWFLIRKVNCGGYWVFCDDSAAIFFFTMPGQWSVFSLSPRVLAWVFERCSLSSILFLFSHEDNNPPPLPHTRWHIITTLTEVCISKSRFSCL